MNRTPDNQIIIESYLVFKRQKKQRSPQTIKIEGSQLNVFNNYIQNKSFKDVNEKDIMNFLDQYKKSTQASKLIVLKMFYRWVNEKYWNGKGIPQWLAEFERRSDDRDKDEEIRKRILTDEQVLRMIDNAWELKHKAIIETLNIYGMRVGELLSMRLSDVNYDGELTRVSLRESKTKKRTVGYNGRPRYLMQWAKEEHPELKKTRDKQNMNIPLWVCERRGYKESSITPQAVHDFIRRIGERAIKRHVTVHDFRHTSISRDLRNGVPRTHICTKHGLKKNTRVFEVYDGNGTMEYEDYLKNNTHEELPETYEQLKKDNETIVEALQQKIEVMMKQLDWQHDIMKKAGLIKPTH